MTYLLPLPLCDKTGYWWTILFKQIQIQLQSEELKLDDSDKEKNDVLLVVRMHAPWSNLELLLRGAVNKYAIQYGKAD